MAALASSGYDFFCFTNSECSEDAFVHQDASVELHKNSYDPEMAAHESPAATVRSTQLKVDVNILLFKESRGQLEKLGRRFC